MGIKDDRKMIGFRATKDQEAKIALLVKASKKSQQDWIMDTLLADTKVTSKSQGILKGAEAANILLRANGCFLKAEFAAYFYSGTLYHASNPAIPSRTELFSLMALEDQAFEAFFKWNTVYSQFYCDLTLVELEAAYSMWLETRDLVNGFPGCDRFLRASHFSHIEDYQSNRANALEAIEKYKASMIGASSPVEVPSDEIAIEAPIEAPAPVKEPAIKVDAPMAKLTRAEFEEIYHFPGATDYVQVVNKARGSVWVSPTDGKAWTVEGFKKQTRWEYLPLFNTLEQPKLDTVRV